MSERLKLIDQKLSEQSRRNDLYKTVYPEIFKAARELMEQAAELQRRVFVFANTWDEKAAGTSIELQKETYRLITSVHSLKWLLGEDVHQVVEDFGGKCSRLVVDTDMTRPNNNYGVRAKLDITQRCDEMETAYRQVVEAVRDHIYLKEFDDLFPRLSPTNQAVVNAIEPLTNTTTLPQKG